MGFEREGGEWTINGRPGTTSNARLPEAIADPTPGRPRGLEPQEPLRRLVPPDPHPPDRLQDVQRTDGSGRQHLVGTRPKDVVYVAENETVRVVHDFGPHTGRYMIHCHNPRHEDHDMMQFNVVGDIENGGHDPLFSRTRRARSRSPTSGTRTSTSSRHLTSRATTTPPARGPRTRRPLRTPRPRRPRRPPRTPRLPRLGQLGRRSWDSQPERPTAAPSVSLRGHSQVAVAAAAVLSLGAAWVHVAYTGSHFREWWAYGLFFLVVAIGQAAFAPAIIRWPSPSLALAGIAVNLGVVVMYVWSRTIGVPMGPHKGVAEHTKLPDLAMRPPPRSCWSPCCWRCCPAAGRPRSRTSCCSRGSRCGPDADRVRAVTALPVPAQRSRIASYSSLLTFLAVAAVLLLGVRVVAEPFRIPSASMAPTLRAGDHVVVDKLAFRIGDAHRGQIAVLHEPGSGDLVLKRIVAVAGDVVGIEDGVLVVESRPPRRACTPIRRASTASTSVPSPCRPGRSSSSGTTGPTRSTAGTSASCRSRTSSAVCGRGSGRRPDGARRHDPLHNADQQQEKPHALDRTDGVAIVLVIALLVVGPKKLPALGRSLGGGMREFKDSVTGQRERLAASIDRRGLPASRRDRASTPADNNVVACDDRGKCYLCHNAPAARATEPEAP